MLRKVNSRYITKIIQIIYCYLRKNFKQIHKSCHEGRFLNPPTTNCKKSEFSADAED